MPSRTYLRLLFTILLIGWVACASPEQSPPDAEPKQDLRPMPVATHDVQELFERSQARWKAQSFRDYQFSFRRKVTGSTESTGPITITVSDGQITEARSRVGRSLGKVDPQQENLYVIDSLFAYLGQMIAEGVDSLVIRYDAEYGFPYFAYLDDWDREHTTSETILEVRDFFVLSRETLPDSLQAGEE